MTTDKEVYTSGEDIKINLKAKNANKSEIDNIVLHSLLPDELETKQTAENTMHSSSLGAGETLDLTFTAKGGDMPAAELPDIGQAAGTEREADKAKTGLFDLLKFKNIFINVMWITMITVLLYSIIKSVKKKRVLIPLYAAFILTITLGWTQTIFADSVNNNEVHSRVKDNYSELEKEIIVDGETYTIKGQIAYGVIKNINLKVCFEDEDGTILSRQEVAYGKSADAPLPPEKEGYTFTGWNSKLTDITSDMTITAQYSRNQYNVIFRNKDDEVIAEQLIFHGEDAEAPEAPEVEGYTFTNWDQPYTKITSDVTVKALYEINTYKVIFKGGDGSILHEAFVNHGAAAEAPAAPAKKGYTFTGWDKSFDPVVSDIEVTALYKMNVVASKAGSTGSGGMKSAGGAAASGSGSQGSAGSGGGAAPAVEAPGTYNDTEARQVLDILNAGRAAKGLGPLSWDSELAGYAKIRAAEIYVSVSHTRPDGSQWYTLNSRIRGENLAGGQQTPQAVYDAWYASPGHYQNMFSSKFKCIGIAKITVPGSRYTHYWVQLFG